MKKYIQDYVDSNENNWAETTKKAEASRLNANPIELLPDASAFYQALKKKGMKPYAIRTTMTRAADFYDWLMKAGHAKYQTNPVREFMSSNARLFKNAYQKKTPDVGFAEAVTLIQTIEDHETKMKALQLLFTGMRFEESNTVDKSGNIVGKGGKARVVNVQGLPQLPPYSKSHVTFWSHLKRVGLTPHMLRKIYATEIAANGANIADIMTIMGWASMNTAASYIASQKQKQITDSIYVAYGDVIKGEKKHAKSLPRKVSKAKGNRK